MKLGILYRAVSCGFYLANPTRNLNRSSIVCREVIKRRFLSYLELSLKFIQLIACNRPSKLRENKLRRLLHLNKARRTMPNRCLIYDKNNTYKIFILPNIALFFILRPSITSLSYS